MSKRATKAVLALMDDDKIRSTKDICFAICGKYSSTVARVVAELRDQGFLEYAAAGEPVSAYKPSLYRMKRVKQDMNGPDNNPFLWKTFRQPEFA